MIRYLIDGYNFLNNSGIETKAPMSAGVSSLSQARQALLDFLVEHLTLEEARETVVVFDAQFQPRPLPTEFSYSGISVKFALRYPDADSLLEHLIAEHTSPRKLLVVSSDHRIQQAARRKRAKFVDSEAWYRELLARKARRSLAPRRPVSEKVPEMGDDVDAETWARIMGLGEEDPLVRETTRPFPSVSPLIAESEAPDSRVSRVETSESSLSDATGLGEPSEKEGRQPESVPHDPFFGLSEEDLSKPIEAFEKELKPAQRRRRPKP